MGVVYKLKQEVIDFIVAQKKADPALSCRKLVEIVQQQHQVVLSKSSVNALIKEFNLSSPVGRKPKFKAPKNFIIPRERKDALREQVKPFLQEITDIGQSHSEDRPLLDGPGKESATAEPVAKEWTPAMPPTMPETETDLPEEEVSAGDREIANPSAVQAEEKAMSPTEKQDIGRRNDSFASLPQPEEDFSITGQPLPEIPVPVSSQNDQAMLLLPDPVAAMESENEARQVEAILDKPSHTARIWGIDDGPLLDGVGGIFLLSLLWEMDREGALGKLAADACSLVPGSPQALAAEGAYIVHAFNPGIAVGEPVVVPSGMAAILGLSEADAGVLLTDIVNTKAADARFRMAAGSALAAATFDVACLEFTTDKGNKFYMDPLMATFMPEPDLSRYHVPLHFALERLTDRFVNNIEPCVFILSREREFLDPFVLSKIAAVAGRTDDPVLSVTVLSSRGEKVAGFSRVPNVEREVIAVGPLTEEAMRAISFEVIESGEEIFEPISEVGGTVAEGRFKIDEKNMFYVDVFTQKNTKDKVLLLNNIKINRNKNLELARVCYLNNPHCLTREPKNDIYKPQEPLNIGISGDIKPLLSICQEHCAFFSKILSNRYLSMFETIQSDDLLQVFCDLKGYVKKHPLGLLVRLVLPADHFQPEAVHRAAAFLNARFLKDRYGQRLYISSKQAAGKGALQQPLS